MPVVTGAATLGDMLTVGALVVMDGDSVGGKDGDACGGNGKRERPALETQ